MVRMLVLPITEELVNLTAWIADLDSYQSAAEKEPVRRSSFDRSVDISDHSCSNN
jgi:hypothetical protein